MDMWGIGIAGISILLYFISKKKNVFLLTTGVGLGILIGAVWASVLINSALSGIGS